MTNDEHEARYPLSVQVDGWTYEAVRSVSGVHRKSQSVRYGGRSRLDLRTYLPSAAAVMLPIARLMLRDMVNEEQARAARTASGS